MGSDVGVWEIPIATCGEWMIGMQDWEQGDRQVGIIVILVTGDRSLS